VDGVRELAIGGRLDDAHRQLLADGTTQFAVPPVHVDPPPAWALAVVDWFKRHGADFAVLGPIVKYAFWGGLLVLLLIVLRAVYHWLAPKLGRASAESVSGDGWRPAAAPARALLAEADALAATGEYAAAARLVLLRSVEQIEAHRADRLMPALTSRDIARSPLLPGDVARAFALIAATVEHGLFAARPVAADAWTRCRAAYEAVAIPKAWT